MNYAGYATAGVLMGCATLGFFALKPVEAEDGAAAEPIQVIDTYELMEDMVEPTFEALKAVAAKEPEGRKDWQALYNGAYTTAELMNLLFFREGEDYTEESDWATFTASGRDAAVQLGEAVKSQDYAQVKAKYLLLVESCNACHTRFIGEDEIPIDAFPEEE